MFLETPWITNSELKLAVSMTRQTLKFMLPEKCHHLQTHVRDPCPTPARGTHKSETSMMNLVTVTWARLSLETQCSVMILSNSQPDTSAAMIHAIQTPEKRSATSLALCP